MYWRPGCPYCAMLRRQLRRTGLSYEPVDIWKDQSGAAYVRSVNNGNETVPTVAVAGHPLTNPSARQVLEAVQRHAPHLLPETAPADAARRWRPRWPWRRTR
ncbi:mycoredoxin [Streptomyces coelicolor]|nr:mycoredoxin [Streptomyces sp. SID7813]NSL84003.1 mycoredoxin [Streptomyces coelicolor]QKN71238.1 mycoredoxin [Streptomyces coelicolor]